MTFGVPRRIKYRNDPNFSERKVWANSVDPDQTAQEQSDQGLHCLLSHYSVVKRYCPNFRMFTALLSGVRIFGIFTAKTTVSFNLVLWFKDVFQDDAAVSLLLSIMSALMLDFLDHDWILNKFYQELIRCYLVLLGELIFT